jgi:hypothetical protein
MCIIEDIKNWLFNTFINLNWADNGFIINIYKSFSDNDKLIRLKNNSLETTLINR